MKLRHLASFMLISIILFGCKKDTYKDPRDAFVGKWKGTVTVIIPSIGNNSQVTTTYIDKSSTEASYIVFDNKNKAQVVGNECTLIPYTEYYTIDGVNSAVVFNGSGVLSGNNLNISGSVSVSLYGVWYDGTWTGNYVRQ